MTKTEAISRHSLERTVFFSDAVIAIAMTLLALELPVPEGKTAQEVAHSFGKHFGHDYVPFLISFAVTAGFWLSHHTFFQHIARLHKRLVMVNLLSLLVIVLVPFATKVLIATSDFWFGAVFYASTMVAFGISYVLMVVTAQHYGLWHAATPPTAAGNMIFGSTSALGIFAVSIPVAFVNPSLAQYSWLAVPVFSTVLPRLRLALRARRAGTHPAQPAHQEPAAPSAATPRQAPAKRR